jgi:hypothetical protein
MSTDDDRALFLGFGYSSLTQFVTPTKKELRKMKLRQSYMGFVNLAKLSRKLKRKRKKEKRK